MAIEVFGIDCATQETKIGVAVGKFGEGGLSVDEAFVCTRKESAAAAITSRLRAGRLRGGGGRTLLAIDAPLGWPQTLARVLANHRAGEPLEAEAHDMFRRETDLFIKKKTGKTPLDGQ